MGSVVQYIRGEDVAATLRSNRAASMLVLDVRDEDFDGGHIRGCVNVESDNFRDAAHIDEVIDRHCMDPKVTTVVVHCMFSQQRGPRCAARLAERLQQRGLAERGPTVAVLRGGFIGFAQRAEHRDLLEDFDSVILTRYY